MTYEYLPTPSSLSEYLNALETIDDINNYLQKQFVDICHKNNENNIMKMKNISCINKIMISSLSLSLICGVLLFFTNVNY